MCIAWNDNRILSEIRNFDLTTHTADKVISKKPHASIKCVDFKVLNLELASVYFFSSFPLTNQNSLSPPPHYTPKPPTRHPHSESHHSLFPPLSRSLYDIDVFCNLKHESNSR